MSKVLTKLLYIH